VALQGAAPTPDEAPLLRAAHVVAAPDLARYREVGRIDPWRVVTVAAEVSGRVVRVVYEAGERVTGTASPTGPGDEALLVEIDRAGYEIAVRRAEASAAAARAAERLALRERDRAQELSRGDGRAMSGSELDRAENAHELAAARAAEAEAALADARLALSRCRVTGPAGARVAARHCEPGDYVMPGKPVVELQDDRSLRVVFEVPGERLAALPLGATVPFEVKEWPDRALSGVVVRAGPRADPRSRRFPVELRVENPDGLLFPGMIAVLELALKRSDAVISVCPREAVGQRLDERFVLVLRPDGHVERRPVLLEDRPELPPDRVSAKGIRPGEIVLLEGLARLLGGERARARLEGAAPEGAR